ncbi:hypothetical protein WA016_01954 [Myxococcus stipitatus]
MLVMVSALPFSVWTCNERPLSGLPPSTTSASPRECAGTPRRVSIGHAPNQCAQFRSCPRPPHPAPGLPEPEEPKAHPMPLHHSRRLNQAQWPAPTLPETLENDPEDPVTPGKPRGWALLSDECELLAKSQVLQRQIRTAPQDRAHRLDQRLQEDPPFAIPADRSWQVKTRPRPVTRRLAQYRQPRTLTHFHPVCLPCIGSLNSWGPFKGPCMK